MSFSDMSVTFHMAFQITQEGQTYLRTAVMGRPCLFLPCIVPFDIDYFRTVTGAGATEVMVNLSPVVCCAVSESGGQDWRPGHGRKAGAVESFLQTAFIAQTTPLAISMGSSSFPFVPGATSDRRAYD